MANALNGMPARVVSSLPTLLPGAPSSLYVDTSGRLYVTGAGGALGDVVGPAAATDNAVVRFDGTTGKLLQDSLVNISDTGQLNVRALMPQADATYALGSGSLRWSQVIAANVTVSNNAGLTFAEASNMVAGTTTGTKIGTSATQKLGFFNATPVVQQPTYTVTTTTPTRTLDGATATTASLANVVAQIIADLKTLGFNA
jgi:hypothetical protein